MKDRCGIILSPYSERIFDLESFVWACPLLDEDGKRRAVIIAGEYFDNIISHGTGLNNEKVLFRIERTDCIRLVFRYTCNNFEELISHANSEYAVFDKKTGRYRGLGLLMCRNLSKNIMYVCGIHKQTVIITL